MAYRLRYTAWVDWVGPGQGPMGGAAGALGGGQGGSGNAQTKEFNNATVNAAGLATGAPAINGTGTGGIIQAADITTLLAAMSADLSLQMNAAPNLGQLQGFATGGG